MEDDIHTVIYNTMCLLYRYDCVCFILNPYCLVDHVYTGIVLPLPPTLRLFEIFIITTDLRRLAVAKVNTPTSNQTAETQHDS